MIISYFKIIVFRVKENIFLTELILRSLYLVAKTEHSIGSKKRAFSLFCKIHRITRNKSLRLRAENFVAHSTTLAHDSVYSAAASERFENLLGSWILTLKAKSSEEKGVLFVMFSECLSLIRDGVNVDELLQDYILVFEPSWSGYCDPDFLYFTQFSDPVFFLAAEKGDCEFLTRLQTNLIPTA